MTKKQAGKNLRNFITDGLPAYMKSSKKVLGKEINHVRHIHMAGKRDRDNNKIERLNGEIRDREKVFRGLKKMDTAVLDGMRVYYNFTKKHSRINGMTPAEASLIEVDGRNKWFTPDLECEPAQVILKKIKWLLFSHGYAALRHFCQTGRSAVHPMRYFA